MIGIIAAMSEELVEITNLMENKTEVKVENTDYVFTKGLLANKEVVVVLGRVAKVNATISTMLLINCFPIDVIINVGSAGGLGKGMKLLDVVVATATAQHDIEVGNGKGILSSQPRFIECDKKLVELASRVLSNNVLENANIYQGLIVSGDQFIMCDQSGEIVEAFPDVMCVEMESAAVNFTCSKMNVPCIIIRSVSDIPSHTDNDMTFNEYLPLAGRNAAIVCKELVKNL